MTTRPEAPLPAAVLAAPRLPPEARLQKWQELAKTLAFFCGGLWLFVEVATGVFAPSGQLELSTERRAGDRLVIHLAYEVKRATVTLSESRVEMAAVEPGEQSPLVRCVAVSDPAERPAMTAAGPVAEGFLHGIFPAGDKVSVDCLAEKVAGCVAIRASVWGQRRFPFPWFGSGWTAAAVSCPERE